MPIRVASGIALPTAGSTWPVPLNAQEASEWCWLACAQMAGNTPPRSAQLQQCQLAQSYVPGAADCCTSKPPPAACNRGGAKTVIQQLFSDHALGFVPVAFEGSPDETQLLAWLAQGPVQVFWSTPDQAHVALIVGATLIGKGAYQYVVNDPWPIGSGQVRSLTFDQLQPTIPSSYDWSWDYVWHC